MRELLRKGLIFFARHLVVSHLLLIFAAQKGQSQAVSLQEHSGCSSARLEYSSGGRVVAGSNPVIPTEYNASRSGSTSTRIAFIAPILRYSYSASLSVEDHAMVPYSSLSITCAINPP